MKKNKAHSSKKAKTAQTHKFHLFTCISEKHYHVSMEQFKKPGQVSLAMAF
jgi:hypothetical protein